MVCCICFVLCFFGGCEPWCKGQAIFQQAICTVYRRSVKLQSKFNFSLYRLLALLYSPGWECTCCFSSLLLSCGACTIINAFVRKADSLPRRRPRTLDLIPRGRMAEFLLPLALGEKGCTSLILTIHYDGGSVWNASSQAPTEDLSTVFAVNDHSKLCVFCGSDGVSFTIKRTAYTRCENKFRLLHV